jgi:hypothetical protein
MSSRWVCKRAPHQAARSSPESYANVGSLAADMPPNATRPRTLVGKSHGPYRPAAPLWPPSSVAVADCDLIAHGRISGGVFHDQIMMANMMERRSKTHPVAPGQLTAIAFWAGTAATTPVDLDLYADFNGVPGRYGRVCG